MAACTRRLAHRRGVSLPRRRRGDPCHFSGRPLATTGRGLPRPRPRDLRGVDARAGRHRPGTARARLLGDPLAAARPGLRPAGGGGACSAAPVVSVRGLDVAVAGRQPVAPLPAPGSAGAARARPRPSVGRRPTRRCPGGAALLVATSVLSYETAVAVLVVAAVAISFRYARGRVALIGALPTVLAVVLAAAVPRLPGLLPGSSPTRASGWGRRSSTPRRSPASR